MYSTLSLLFGLVLVALTYGLSFFPSGSLNRGEDTDDAIIFADQDSAATFEEKAASDRNDVG